MYRGQKYRGAEEIIETKIMKEIEVDLEKDSIHKILERITKAVVVDLDQVQEIGLIEIGSDVIDVENMIILQKAVLHQN